MFRGTYTALVTPFRDGEIDVPALEKLIEGQIADAVTGLIAVGTTGESPTLDHAEHVGDPDTRVERADLVELTVARRESDFQKHQY